MAISKESKQALRQQIETYNAQKKVAQNDLAKAQKIVDKLTDRVTEINNAISKLRLTLAEILNSISHYTPVTAEMLRSEAGIAAINNMFRMIFENLPADGEGIGIYRGYGSPENLVAAKVGSFYQRLDGGVTTTLYVKTSGTGATGWTNK